MLGTWFRLQLSSSGRVRQFRAFLPHGLSDKHVLTGFREFANRHFSTTAVVEVSVWNDQGDNREIPMSLSPYDDISKYVCPVKLASKLKFKMKTKA